jgi:hypothetical protein
MIRDPKKQKSLRNLHRFGGLISVVFVIVLVVTGIMLNHTEGMSLDERTVGSAAVKNWYGLDTPDSLRGYSLRGQWLIQAGDKIFLDDTPIADCPQRIVGAAVIPDGVAAATEDSLLLFTADGQLIEKIGAESGLPLGITGLAATDSHFVVAAGGSAWSTTVDVDEWEEIKWQDWSKPLPLPPEIATALQPHISGDGITLERLVLDIHSGRILGPVGVLLVDAAALLLLFLAVSGLLIHFSGRGKKE